MRGMFVLAVVVALIWIVGDEIAGNKKLSSLLTQSKKPPAPPKAAWVATSKELKFVTVFLVSAGMMQAFIGDGFAIGFMTLVLLSMLVANADTFNKFLGSVSKL